jgi:CDP-paratose 2-epimerase
MRRHREDQKPVAEPIIGLVEWFRPGEYDRVETVLADAKSLGVQDLRTGISWADWYASEGNGWHAWLLPRLARDVRVLPCFFCTPHSLGIVPKLSSPPANPKGYADFLDVMITRFGELFEWIELWDNPNNIHNWDVGLDPHWRIFTEMIGGAAYWARARGKKAVLSGLWPPDGQWLQLMHERGVLNYIDAVSLQGFPSNPEVSWRGWQQEVREVRNYLEQIGSKAEVWITQAGFSTWREGEWAQARAFAETVQSPVDRIYWQETRDHTGAASTETTVRSDEREHHYGVKRADGTPKLLARLWSDAGPLAVVEATRTSNRSRKTTRKRHVLITGGAGFIGVNLAHRLLSGGHSVLIYDDCSRTGVEHNLRWLNNTHSDGLSVSIADVRDNGALREAVASAGQVFHFAAQVAVTTSLADPRTDFEVNVGGTLNLLEALRARTDPPPLLFTSTNKVYGALAGLALERNCTRYQPIDAGARAGIGEDHKLDFHSPYGCSKGAADQYVLDYARTYGIPATVFRMSCIYGPHQMGTEDQGWVAHFLIRTLTNQPIVICGDGMQVRDILFIDDLVDAFLLAQANIHTLSGQAFNIGGGLGNTTSLLDLLDTISQLHGAKPAIHRTDWRPGDQRYYVSDTRKFKAATGWSPKINVRLGVEKLYHWLAESYGIDVHAPTPSTEDLHAIFAN